jgi:hypothetical protein
LQERQATIDEDDGGQQGGYPCASPKCWRAEAQPVLEHGGVDENGDGEDKADPKAVAKQNLVPHVAVMAMPPMPALGLVVMGRWRRLLVHGRVMFVMVLMRFCSHNASVEAVCNGLVGLNSGFAKHACFVMARDIAPKLEFTCFVGGKANRHRLARFGMGVQF